MVFIGRLAELNIAQHHLVSQPNMSYSSGERKVLRDGPTDDGSR